MLAVGRLIAQKDHATLLRAFARVRRRVPEARLAILGCGAAGGRDEGARCAARARRRRARSPAASSRRRLARARRRVRPHVALGGVRDRPARGDALAPRGRRDERQRRARDRRRRRDGHPRRAGRRRRDRGGTRFAPGGRRPPARARRGRLRACARASSPSRAWQTRRSTSIGTLSRREGDPPAASSSPAPIPRRIGSRSCRSGSTATTTRATPSCSPASSGWTRACCGCSDRRIPRGIQYRVFQRLRRPLQLGVLGAASRRYRNLLTLDFDQLAAWRGAAVMDADDPFFRPREIELLNRPSLRAYVVTAERAARRYEALGVQKPWVVIPQGVSLGTATPALRAEAAQAKTPGELVLGWIAAHLLTEGDRGRGGALQRRPPARAVEGDPRPCPARAAVARGRAERPPAPAPRGAQRRRPVRAAAARPRARDAPRNSTSRCTRARSTWGSEPRRPRS